MSIAFIHFVIFVAWLPTVVTITLRGCIYGNSKLAWH